VNGECRTGGERELRAGSEGVGSERDGGGGRKQVDSGVGDIGFRGVHKVGAEAGGHAAGGAGGGVCGAAGERGVDKADIEGDEGDVLLDYVHGGSDVRAGGENKHLGDAGLGRDTDPDAVHEQRVGPDRVRVQSGERDGGDAHS